MYSFELHLLSAYYSLMLLGNFMKMPSTVVGRGFSPEEDNTLSEITSSLLSSLMVSSKVLFVFLNWFYDHFDAISIF